MSVAAALNTIANLTPQEPTVTTTATLIETNFDPESWTGDHRLYRLDPPLDVDATGDKIEYVVTVVVSFDSASVPDELRPAEGQTDGTWFPAFEDGVADNFTDFLLGSFEEREVAGTATHESILALIPAEVAA